MSIGLCCPDALIENYAERLKVCGHPVRLKILCLIERQDCCVTDLWRCLNQSQPVISQHLAVLKEKQIVHSDIRGNKRIYSIIDPFIQDLVRTFNIPDDESVEQSDVTPAWQKG